MTRAGPREDLTCRRYILPALRDAGWNPDQVSEQHYFTDGRIVSSDRRGRRREGLRADYLLEVHNVRVAVIEAKRLYRRPADGLQQAMKYAEVLGLPLAYGSNGKGIVEHDYDTGRQEELRRFPTPDEMWARYRASRGIRDDRVAAAIARPFNRDLRNPDGSVKTPRYYQRIAVDRAVQAVLEGKKRILLTMATGAGKTFVALQTAWKLWDGTWRPGRNPRVLYLTDRNILVDQPIEREFRPVFGDAIWKIRGEVQTSREMYFALYQALADSGDALGIFRSYPRDFFDLVIVDECHRGSARDESSWRTILDHFAPATQLGMTATPLRKDNVDTYDYFGVPVYEYSLAQGIEDGFLAPYRVRRVVLSPDAFGWSPAPEQLDRFGREIPPGLYSTREFERLVSLLSRTEAAAKHLTDYLRRTGRMNKTIVFCVDIEHAEQMRAALHRANEDLTRQFPHYVARIVSEEGATGMEHLDDFADPERDTPVVATTSRLLSTGVDLPTVRNIVIFRPIGSMVEFKQIIGRGTRLFPDADKLTFDIVDYVGATSLFDDPAFDGPPEMLQVEEITEDGEVVTPREVASPEPGLDASLDGSAPGGGEPEEDAAALPGARKYYVDELEVHVTAESVRILDPGSRRLRTVAYESYVADTVRRLFPHPRDLRSRWRGREGRDAVLETLGERGITVAELAERTGHVEADPLDLLIHLAWNQPMRSRRERADVVRRDHAGFLDTFTAQAREILQELLDKYAEHGPEQLDDMRVLEIPPLSDHGSPVDIAARFGGAERLRDAVARLAELIYAA